MIGVAASFPLPHAQVYAEDGAFVSFLECPAGEVVVSCDAAPSCDGCECVSWTCAPPSPSARPTSAAPTVAPTPAAPVASDDAPLVMILGLCLGAVVVVVAVAAAVLLRRRAKRRGGRAAAAPDPAAPAALGAPRPPKFDVAISLRFAETHNEMLALKAALEKRGL